MIVRALYGPAPQLTAIPSPPAAPGTVTEPAGVSTPSGPTRKASTSPGRVLTNSDVYEDALTTLISDQ